ncbi:unnamed protein product [Ixodes pacificus]
MKKNKKNNVFYLLCFSYARVYLCAVCNTFPSADVSSPGRARKRARRWERELGGRSVPLQGCVVAFRDVSEFRCRSLLCSLSHFARLHFFFSLSLCVLTSLSTLRIRIIS